MPKPCNLCGQGHPKDVWCSEVLAMRTLPPIQPTSKHGKYADKEKRKAYMREYMAKRNKKLKDD